VCAAKGRWCGVRRGPSALEAPGKSLEALGGRLEDPFPLLPVLVFFQEQQTLVPVRPSQATRNLGDSPMNGLIYLIGLIVVILAILSFFGLR
jgi:hypothetical protein